MLTKRSLLAAAALSAAFAFSAPALAMKIDGFLKVPDIPGESISGGSGGWIELESISFGDGRRGARPASKGGGAANITLKRGVHSDALDRAARVKTKFPWATLRVTDSTARAGYIEYKLENVYISSYQTGAASASEPPTESVSFVYQKISW